MKTVDSTHERKSGDNPQSWPGSTHPFLQGLSLRRVHQLLYGATVVHFDAGKIVFCEGDPADRFFLVQSGLIALETLADGHVIQIDTVRAGEVFGWSWLFPPFSWHLRARVLEPAEIVVCDAGRLLVRCEEDPAFGYELMKRISQLVIHRLQATRQRLRGIEFVLNPPQPSARIS